VERDVVRRGFGVVGGDDGAGAGEEGDGGELGCDEGVEGGGFAEEEVESVEDWMGVSGEVLLVWRWFGNVELGRLTVA